MVQYITEAQAHGAKPLLENDDEHGIDLSNIEHMNFGSDACSGTLRFANSSSLTPLLLSNSSYPKCTLLV